MKIVVTGTRGIPGIQGGVETHCEELFPRMVDSDHEIIVVRRKGYIVPGLDTRFYKGVYIKDLGNLSSKHLEAFVHTFVSVLYAKWINADIVHIHAVGPSLMTPLARLLGMKVVCTHHGPDYDRQKWGRLAKAILRLGECLGMKYANAVIVISRHIENLVRRKYPSQKNVNLVFNGVNLPEPSSIDLLQELGISGCKYILAVGRLVKEKGFDLLLDAYARLDDKSVRLVIAGDADHSDSYSCQLKEKARLAGAVLTGFIQKDKLVQLYRGTSLFVLPSYHEGLPISLLEAMSCGCNVLVSDIPANKEVGLSVNHYFVCGDTESLLRGMNARLQDVGRCQYDMHLYDWDVIASQTKKIYDSLM